MPTLVEGVYANAFTAPGKRVFTLHNSRPETVTAEVLHVPHRPGARYEDAWNGRVLQPRIAGGQAYLRISSLAGGCPVRRQAPRERTLGGPVIG